MSLAELTQKEGWWYDYGLVFECRTLKESRSKALGEICRFLAKNIGFYYDENFAC